jgi:hypothetical protein
VRVNDRRWKREDGRGQRVDCLRVTRRGRREAMEKDEERRRDQKKY